MKKTKLTRSLLAACSIVALSAVMYGCVHSGDDAPAATELSLSDAQMGQELPAGRYNATPELVAAIEGATDAALEAAAGSHATGAMITLAGLDFECVSGPCSVTVAPDGSHFTTTGTIRVMEHMAAVTPDPEPTPEEQLEEAQMLVAAAEAAVAAATTSEQYLAAYTQLGAAQAALAVAAALPENVHAALEQQVTDLKDQLDDAGAFADALSAATTAVDGLDEDSTDQDIADANTAVAAVQGILDAADDLGSLTTTLQGLIDSLDGRLDGIEDDIELARMDTGPSQEVQDDAMLVAMAIVDGPPADATPDDANLGPRPFEIDGGEVTTLPDDMDMSDDFVERPMYGSSFDDGNDVTWAASYHDRSGDTTYDGIVNFTDIEAPTDQAYSDYYPNSIGAGDRAGVTSATDGVLSLSIAQTGNSELFSITFGITAAHQTIPIVHDDPATMDVTEDETTYTGMFNGVPGTFTCTGTCSVESDAMGSLDMLNGTWTFEPDEVAQGADPHMVAGAIPDPDYMDIGYWEQHGTDEDGEYTFALLAHAQSNRDTNTDVSGLEGTASYAGPALGKYMTKLFDPVTGAPIPNGSGHFDAWAELTANFGGDDVAVNAQDSITGTVKYFQANDENGDYGTIPGTEGWVLNLMQPLDEMDMISDTSNIEATAGTFSGTTLGMNGDIAGTKGGWIGTFNGAADDQATDEVEFPVSVSGTFDGHFNNGHVLGAFGANIKDD